MTIKKLFGKHTIPLGIILILFAVVQFRIMPHTLGFGDEGELVSAAYGFGLTHPPGFPGYLIPAFLFSRLCFWWEPALSLHIFSVFGAILMLLAAHRLIHISSDQKSGPVLFAVMALPFTWAVLPLFSRFVVGAEVYTWMWFWLLIAMGSLIRYQKNANITDWRNHWFFWAIAVTVHPFALFFAVYPIAIAARNPKTLSASHLTALLPGALLGLLYLLPLVVTHRQDVFIWPHEPGLQGWFKYVTAADYRDHIGGGQSLLQTFSSQIQIVTGDLATLPIIFFFAFCGLVILLYTVERKKAPFSLPLLIATLFLTLFPFTSAGLVDSLDRNSYVIVPFAAAVLSAAHCLALQLRSGGRTAKVANLIGAVIIIGLSVFLLGRPNPGKHNRYPDFLAKTISESLPKNSILLVKDDASFFSLAYLQKVKGRRTDLCILHLDLLAKHPEFYRTRFPGIAFAEQPSLDPLKLPGQILAANPQRTVVWFGEEAVILPLGPPRLIGCLYLLQGEPFQSPSFLDQYLELEPEVRAAFDADPAAAGILAMIIKNITNSYLRQGQTQVAEALLDRWLSEHPEDAKTRAYKALLLIRGNRLDDAEQVLAAEPSEKEPAIIQARGALMQARGEDQERLDLYEANLHQVRRNLNLAFDYVRTAMALGDFQKAFSFLETLPEDPNLVPLTAEVYFNAGESQRAVALLEQHIQERPNDAAAYQKLIYIHTITGGEQEQITWIRNFQEQFPNHPANATYDEILMRKIIEK